MILIRMLFKIIEWILDFLRQPNKVRFQLLFCIHGCQVVRACKTGYQQTLSQSLAHPELTDSGRPPTEGQRNEKNKNNINNSMVVYDLQKNRLFKFYTTFSTGYMIYATLRTSFRALLVPFVPLYDCYLPGVFVLHFYHPLSKPIGYIFAICHLVWRLAQASLRRPLRLTMLFYMLQSEDSIQRHLQLFGNEHTEARLRALGEDGRLTQLDLFLHRILYFTVRHKTRTVYKLRPNRTLESRRLIADQVAKCTLLCFSIFCILFWSIFPPVLFDVLRDQRYVSKYKGCQPDLERQVEEAKVGYWSMSFLPHRLYSGIFDGFENILLWIDSAIALYFCLPFAYQLNYDVIIYWRHLDRNLSDLKGRIELNFTLKEHYRHISDQSEDTFRWIRPVGYDPKIQDTRSQRWCRRAFRLMKADGSSTRDLLYALDDAHGPYRQFHTKNQTMDLDREVLEIQAEISDFFHQIELVDAYVSDIISASIIIWLFAFAIITYISLVKVAGYVPLFLRIYETCGFIMFTLSNFFLLTLHRKTMSMYRFIVSLMALDQSEHKGRFLRILEFYTKRNRSAYTVLHRTPFLATTYLSIIGWSLSSLFIIENLFQKGK